MVVVVGDSAL